MTPRIPVTKHMGHFIHARRMAIGISQKSLAKRVGVTHPTISNYERAKISTIRIFTLDHIMKILRVPKSIWWQLTTEGDLAYDHTYESIKIQIPSG